MRLNVRLPKVEPLQIQPPTHCPLPDRKHPKKKCGGTRFKVHQWNCRKPLRDMKRRLGEASILPTAIVV